jgi:hypothetical protein
MRGFALVLIGVGLACRFLQLASLGTEVGPLAAAPL